MKNFFVFLFFRKRMPLAKKWLETMENHAARLGIDSGIISARIASKKDLDLFILCRTREEWEFRNMSKEELILQCRQKIHGFKQSMHRKPKTALIHLLMTENGIAEKIPEDPLTLTSLKKQRLIEIASTHPDFKKSYEKKTKDQIISFILQKKIEHETGGPLVENEKKASLSRSSLARLTKNELIDRARTIPGFDLSIHGKTKKSLVDFLRAADTHLSPEKDNPPPPPAEIEEGYSPVRISSLLKNEPEVDASHLRETIFKCLMSSEPFKNDKNLKQKIAAVL